MVKKIAVILLALIIIGYIIYAVIFLNPEVGNVTCKDLKIEIVDTLDRHFISNKDVTLIIKNAGLSPIGKNMKEIDIEKIEQKIQENKLIKRAECYKTTNGTLKIDIYQKIPIFRVISRNESYFIDDEGGIMPSTGSLSAYLPVATGYIEKEYAKTKLYDFALFLHNNKFWNSQIEQIYINSNGDVELIPRVGNHQIILGKIDDYKENLEKLKLFYEKGLNTVGWNRYSVINLKYKNQVVCTKIDQEKM